VFFLEFFMLLKRYFIKKLINSQENQCSSANKSKKEKVLFQKWDLEQKLSTSWLGLSLNLFQSHLTDSTIMRSLHAWKNADFYPIPSEIRKELKLKISLNSLKKSG